MIVMLLILLAFVWAAASVYYQNVIRPGLGDSMRFKVFRLRDDLRRMVIERRLEKSSFEYQYLENIFNAMVNSYGWISLSHLIEFTFEHRRGEKSSPDTVKFDRLAPAELKRMESSAVETMLLVMLVNSPGYAIVFAAYLAIIALKGGLATYRKIVLDNARQIWHFDMPEQSKGACPA